jgi:hypothetical protein
MKPGRIPTDVYLLFFLFGHDHLSTLRQDSHSDILRQCFTATLLIGRTLRMLF